MEMSVLINQLGVPHRATAAYRELLSLGFAVAPAACEGLRHENAMARHYCCLLLDHFLVPEALEPLLDKLQDPAWHVRQVALHTLACERCKEGTCRPVESDVLPAALRLLNEDEDAHVRAMAVEVVGQYVHKNPVAEQALVTAHHHDSSPAVRKKAGWYAPGGTIYRRTMPHPVGKG